MIGHRADLLLTLLLVVAACTPLPRKPGPAAPYFAASERQMLVMLRQAPSHFRADANYSGGYDAGAGRAARRRGAARIAADYHLDVVAEWPMPALGVDCFVMETTAPALTAPQAARLAQDPRVESAQTMNVFHTLGDADPLYPLQPTAAAWHLAQVHRVTTGRQVLIAIVDSGVDNEHPDLVGQVQRARDFVDDGANVAEDHGTAVAGIIAARADNGVGIAGIAPQARLLALRACWQEQAGVGAAQCNSFTLAKALQFALDQDVSIINLSLGGPRDRLLERLLDVAMARHISVVGASDAHLTDGGFPAAYPGVLAATGAQHALPAAAVFVAPDRDIPTTLPRGRWGFVSGASFAAAELSGAVALLRQLAPDMSAQRLRTALRAGSATQVAANQAQTINICAAVTSLLKDCVCDCTLTREAALPHR